jgi:DNA-binding GntR family transcriptional regulator
MSDPDLLFNLGGNGQDTSSRRRTRSQEAYETLREQILTGKLAPGERIPVQELADSLKMSPMPVREAVRELAAAGLVDSIPRRGARVAAISIGDMEDVYQLRLALETLAIRRAAERFSHEDAVRSRRLLDELNDLPEDDLTRRLAVHTDFHFSLYEAADSNWMVRLIRPLWEASSRYRFAAPFRGRIELAKGEHDALLKACIAHDARRGSALLYNHLARAANMLAEAIGAPDLFELQKVPALTRRRAV